MNHDPLSDMLTRIRNAIGARKQTVVIECNKLCANIAQVLLDEGFINAFHVDQVGPRKLLTIELKYTPTGESVIGKLKALSTPGRRLYRKAAAVPNVNNGLGIAVLSTPLGVLSSNAARQNKVGGELLCTIE